jgi:hypothetical protein
MFLASQPNLLLRSNSLADYQCLFYGIFFCSRTSVEVFRVTIAPVTKRVLSL